MFDNAAKQLLDPWLDRLGKAMAARRISANAVTIAGLALGCVAGAFIALEYWQAGLLFIGLSRLCDGLDGAVARATAKTDFGAYLDIVLDFAFYGLIPLAFAFANPAQNAVAAALLLLSFYFNGASFLAFAVIAEKRGLPQEAQGRKSFLFTTGLAEASETLAVFVAMCLFPQWFASLAIVYAAMVFYTGLSRILLARNKFGT